MTFAQALRAAMNGMTQQQLEKLSGVSQNAISRYLRGADPSLSRLIALEKALPKLREFRDKVVAA